MHCPFCGNEETKVNFSGKLFNATQYGIRPDNGEIDYDALERQA
ncbi:MAG: hypothetical protein EB048_10735, partial [Gammaproteobacteria bacterium]|nr:hypothetical protein [Gammaproteobacteria bacterium]